MEPPRANGVEPHGSANQQQIPAGPRERYFFDHAILGGGNVAGYAAREFVRTRGGPMNFCEVCIVTDEAVCPYERPALSKGVIMGKAKLPGFHTCAAEGSCHTQDWYQENNVHVFTNSRCTAIDFRAKCLIIESQNMEIQYGKLLLATGAASANLTAAGANLKGIHYMRSINDANKLLADIDDKEARGAKDCGTVIVGGGYIAMESAACLLARGHSSLSIVHRAPWLLRRLWSHEIGFIYEQFFIARGCRLIPNGEVASFSGDSAGMVTSVNLHNNEDLHTRMVIVGVGVALDLSIYKGLLMSPEGWVKVDAYMRTSAPDVYGAGDLVSFPLPRYGRRSSMNEKTVTNARRSAEHAVRHMLGILTKPYDILPYCYSRFFNLNWHFWGDACGKVLVKQQLEGTFPGKSLRMVAIWVGDDKRINAVMCESCSDEELKMGKTAANDRPRVDIKALNAASSVEKVFEIIHQRHLLLSDADSMI